MYQPGDCRPTHVRTTLKTSQKLANVCRATKTHRNVGTSKRLFLHVAPLFFRQTGGAQQHNLSSAAPPTSSPEVKYLHKAVYLVIADVLRVHPGVPIHLRHGHLGRFPTKTVWYVQQQSDMMYGVGIGGSKLLEMLE